MYLFRLILDISASKVERRVPGLEAELIEA